mmetsp:Transcript_27155/g.49011  ORF Transcript_27155/g.49011 Transcript_27155/m.49011 type:complete len:317 (+) Transcript_27155:537-1487(+)
MSRRLAQLFEQLILHLANFSDIHLVQHHHLRFLRQQFIIHLQLIIEHLKIPNGIHRSTIHHMQQHLTPLHMPQERKPKSRPLRRTLDQTGNITQHQPTALLAQITHTQIRHNGRKRIIRNLGPRRTRTAQQRRLARIRHAQKAHIGNQPQFNAQPPLHTRFPPLTQLGRRSSTRHERGISPPASSSGSNHELLPVGSQLPRHPLGMELPHDCPAWHTNIGIVSVLPIFVFANAIIAALGLDVDFRSQTSQRVEGGVGTEDYGAAGASTAAVGASHGLALFATEGDTAIAASTGGHGNTSGIEEFVFLVVVVVGSGV